MSDETTKPGQAAEARGLVAFPSYLFFDDGNVFSNHTRKFLRPQRVNGYLHVTLCEEGVKRQIGLHVLICRAFHGEPPAGHVVNHRDLNRANDAASNLEWVTQSENVKHAYATGARVINDAHRERCAALGRAKRKTKMEGSLL